MLMVAASAVAFWGVLETVIRRESRLNPAYALTPSAARAARISWLLILGPIFLVTIVVACILPDLLNKTAVTILFTIALGVGSYLAWGWAALMRILGVIRPASDRLRSVVERTAEKAGVFPRAVVQVGLPMANAFAFTLEGKLGVTDATLAVLDDEGARRGLRPRTGSSPRAAPGGLGPCLTLLPDRTVSGPVGGLGKTAARELWPLGLSRGHPRCVGLADRGIKLSNRLSLKMEHRADAQATESQSSPGVYARALEKLYQTNLVPAVLRSKQLSHPDLYDRMVQAGVTPDYARPAPPPRWASLLGFATLLFAAFLGICSYRLVTRTLPDALLDHKASIMWRIGGGQQDFHDLMELLEVPRIYEAL